MIDLRVIGSFEVRGADGEAVTLTQPKRLALLLYLALAEPLGLHSRERLLALLWPEADGPSSRHSLRNALHALRQACGDDAIVTRGETMVGLNASVIRCDALELRAHLGARRLDEALAIWRGELAAGFHVSGAPDFEHWLDDQRAQMRDSVRAAAWQRARELSGAGRAELEAVRRALRLDPGDEPGVRSLMRLLASAGDHANALRTYQSLANYLSRELEVEPSDATRALAHELRSTITNGRTGNSTLPVAPTAMAPDPVPVGGHVLPATPVPAFEVPRWMITIGTVVALTLVAATYFTRAPRVASPDSEAERAVLRLPARYRQDTSAYRSYLRGLTLRFEFDFRASRDSLKSLVEREPLYVPGLFGLAHAHALMASNDISAPEDSWPKVEMLARRALALDSTAASAWLALAASDMHWRLDLESAGEKVDRARMLDSLDPDVHALRSVWLRSKGEMESAVAAARHASRLDPLSRYFERLLAKQLYFARRYDESLRLFGRMLQDDPAWTRGYEDVAELHLAMGNPRDAVEWRRRARLLAGDTASAAALSGATSDTNAKRLLADDVRRRIERLDRSRPGARIPVWNYAAAYAELGDSERTLVWLDSVSAHRLSMAFHAPVDPRFDFLRVDPRYRAWEERAGLKPSPGSMARR